MDYKTILGEAAEAKAAIERIVDSIESARDALISWQDGTPVVATQNYADESPSPGPFVIIEDWPTWQQIRDALTRWQRLREQAWIAYEAEGGVGRSDLQKPPWDRP